MARYTGPSCRICRREGEKLFLKGERCYSNKCAVARRSYAPGQHGQQKKKLSEYGLHLREKQKARRFYGILEGQFRKYFEMASSKKGITGENLLQILEMRLDNIIYRMGLAASRPEARQLVKHGFFTVNGRTVDIPSYLTKVGDVISIKENKRSKESVKEINDNSESRLVPKWLEYDSSKMEGRIVTLPSREDIDLQVKEHLIVEFYSK